MSFLPECVWYKWEVSTGVFSVPRQSFFLRVATPTAVPHHVGPTKSLVLQIFPALPSVYTPLQRHLVEQCTFLPTVTYRSLYSLRTLLSCHRRVTWSCRSWMRIGTVRDVPSSCGSTRGSFRRPKYVLRTQIRGRRSTWVVLRVPRGSPRGVTCRGPSRNRGL